MAKLSSASRRRALKSAAAAAIGGGAALFGGGSLAAQGGAPAIVSNNQNGRKYRAFAKFGPEPPSVVELTARGLTGNQVLLRVEAAQTCASTIDQVLLDDARTGGPGANPTVVGHGGVGIVEAVGPAVNSTRVGDRVIVNLHASCGRCWNCLNMRSDKCRSGQGPAVPFATLPDGRPVFGRTGAMAELCITTEEMVTTLFTDVSSPEIAMLTCVGGCGLGMTMTNCPVEVASDVVIFGAGPVGLSAVMGAKVKGASRIIVIEPIPYRRELALKLGATHVVDPNQYTARTPIANPATNGDRFRDALVEHLREMTRPRTDRAWSGGGKNGPDHIIEAVGGDRWKPRRQPQGPDPTGITVLNQCWELCSSIGSIVTCSVGQPAGSYVSFPASQWSDGAKHHWPGTGGGTNDRRDSPRYVRLIETGQINMKALVGGTYPLAQTKAAFEIIADRDLVATVVTPGA